MAINPPSDIVLDVVRAADPASSRAAAAKLGRLGYLRDAESAEFAEVLGGPRRIPGPTLPFDPATAMTSRRNGEALAESARPVGGKTDPYRQFEAFVLQSFIQSMFPDDAEAVFGSGNAGSYWKAMLSEQIASEVARAGGIGIAERIAPGTKPAAVPGRQS